MNCEPGDLAFTRCASGRHVPDEYLGRLVTVIQAAPNTTDLGPLWRVRPVGWKPPECTLDASGCFRYPDELLRPLRTQGPNGEHELNVLLPRGSIQGPYVILPAGVNVQEVDWLPPGSEPLPVPLDRKASAGRLSWGWVDAVLLSALVAATVTLAWRAV